VKRIEHVAPRRAPDGSIVLRFSAAVYPDDGSGRVDLKRMHREPSVLRDIGELHVGFDDTGQPRSVTLDMDDGLTPTDLQRFPWARWLRVADAYNRRPPDERPPHPAGFDAELDKDTSWGQATMALAEERGTPIASRKRPGRKGHPDQHYQDIARRYDQLVVAGARNPTAQLGQDLNYSRNTVAGWISTARKRGYLPPARHGRPG
jgi:hypothetical protein